MKDKWIDENPMQLTPGSYENGVVDGRESMDARRVDLLRKTKEMPSWDQFAMKLREFPYMGRDGKLNLDACFGLLCSYAETCNSLVWSYYPLVRELREELENAEARVARYHSAQEIARNITKSVVEKTKRPGRPKTNRG